MTLLEQLVERGTADTGGSRNLGLLDARAVCSAYEPANLGHGFAGVALSAVAAFPEYVKVTENADLSVHAASVKHLTRERKGRKVLYMKTHSSQDRRDTYAKGQAHKRAQALCELRQDFEDLMKQGRIDHAHVALAHHDKLVLLEDAR